MSWKFTALVAVAIIAIAGIAVAAKSGSKNLVLCATKKGGDLSLATAKGKCNKGEKKLTVAKEGPIGPAGPQGAVGPQGPDGPAGATGTPETPHLVAPKTTACAVTTGAFCVTESGLCWNNENAGGGLTPVAYSKDSGGYVHLEGAYVNTNPQGACGGIPTWPVFYLPQGFKPAGGTQRFSVARCTGTELAYVTIDTDGRVGAGGNCVDLSGIVFHAGA